MTCHVARRVGEFERRLRRDRWEVCHALVTTDAELAGLERPHRGDVIDEAARETTRRVLARLEERDRHVLAEIDAAEERLSTGTFGVCEACARPIPLPRLRALPMARLCIACEKRVERAERRLCGVTGADSVMTRGEITTGRSTEGMMMGKVVVAILGIALLFGVGSVYAQAPADPHHPPVAAPAPGGMQGPQGAGTMPMMDMCRQMMAGPMMGTDSDQKMDPKMMAHMLQMRGEMMKAMGEVMLKHGRMMEGKATR